MRDISELDRETLRSLAEQDFGEPVLSIYARTDPRDPANTNHSPAWEIELRNGLSRVEKELNGKNGNGDLNEEEAGLRQDYMLFASLRDRVERELAHLGASDRGRSVAWFLGANGQGSQRYSLQIPVRHDCVVWDARPFVTPLVDVVERGEPTGLVVVNGDHVRLLHIEMGQITEPEDSTYTLEVGDWRSYEAYVSPNPARGQQSVSHVDHYEARMEEQRSRFFETAAKETLKRLGKLGWDRIAVVAEPGVAKQFQDEMPRELADRTVAHIDYNIGHEEPSQIAAAIAPRLDEVYHQKVSALVEEACERAAAGGPASLGPQETLGALGEGRVEHLFINPDADYTDFIAAAPSQMVGPSDMLAERAVEAAISTGARVSSLSEDESPRLAGAGGMVALLRY